MLFRIRAGLFDKNCKFSSCAMRLSRSSPGHNLRCTLCTHKTALQHKSTYIYSVYIAHCRFAQTSAQADNPSRRRSSIRSNSAMEEAAAAMEKVPLMQATNSTDATADATADTKDTTAAITPPPATETTYYAASTSSDNAQGPLERFLERLHRISSQFCHKLGGFFLRALSSVMLLVGIVAAVMVQTLAYYYTGVLNGGVLVACALYAPALAAMSVLREELLAVGSSVSGTGPYRTRLVTLAYLVLSVCGFASLCQPLVMHGDGVISVKSMWTGIGGSVFFYYCLLISEVLFAAAHNVSAGRDEDAEGRRREAEDPLWYTQYESMEAGRSRAGASTA